MKSVKPEMKRFNHLTTEIEAAYHEASLKLGLSDSAMQILYVICENGESCLLSDVARLTGISRQTLHSALRRLEKDGLVFPATAGGRLKRLCLTEQGKEIAGRTVYRIIEIENNIFDSWKQQELEQYLELTWRYLTAFQDGIRKL